MTVIILQIHKINITPIQTDKMLKLYCINTHSKHFLFFFLLCQHSEDGHFINTYLKIKIKLFTYTHTINNNSNDNNGYYLH